MKLNLCSGNMPQHGYKNLDKYYYPPQTEMHPEHGKPEDYDWEYGDLTDLSRFEDNSIEEVMIVHGLEHTYWDGAVKCVKEIYRILEPGGVVDIEVPDLDSSFRFDTETMQDIVFGGRTENALTFGHFCGFTKNILLNLLEKTGFVNIVETEVGKATGKPEPDRNFRLKGIKPNYLVVDFDDFGVDEVISSECQVRDCRKELEELKNINPNFKVTLFAVFERVDSDIQKWAEENKDWVELAIHGYSHSSNYECSEWSKEQCKDLLTHGISSGYAKVFKAPGWQISDGCYEALKELDFTVADQPYNDDRRPDMKVYKIGGQSIHGHTWNTCGNGIQETLEDLKEKIKGKEFKFISEVS